MKNKNRQPHFLFLIGAMLLVACTDVSATPTPSIVKADPTLTPDPLSGTQWRLVSMDGQRPIQGTRITLAFDHGILNGSAGCNNYGGGPDSGPYSATMDGILTIRETAITVMACPEPAGVMEQENAYMKLLQQAATFHMTNEQLEIIDQSEKVRLVFEREP